MEPKMRLFFCVLCLSASCLGASAARAQTSSEWIIARMGGALRADVTWEQVRSNMLMAFYQSNPDERGVTPQGIDNLRRSVMAQRRAQAIAQILNYDLDGDGSVSKDEITVVMQPRARQMIHVNGVQLEPTPQQVRLQLDKLISTPLSRIRTATALLLLRRSSRMVKGTPNRPAPAGNRTLRSSFR
jgi:hypothetical protein